MLLFVQTFSDLFGIALVIQCQETVEDLTTRCLPDCEADTLLRFVKAVTEVEVIPAIGGCYG